MPNTQEIDQPANARLLQERSLLPLKGNLLGLGPDPGLQGERGLLPLKGNLLGPGPGPGLPETVRGILST